MLIPKDGQSFDWQSTKGEIIPDVCPYFEGREVRGQLNPDGTIDDYHLKIYVNDKGIENFITVSVCELINSAKLAAALANEGLILPNRQTKDVSELLTKQAQELMRNPTVTHKRLGIANLNEQTVFLRENNLVGEKRYEYQGSIVLKNGNRQAYESFLHNVVFKSRNLTLAYMIGMSAPVVSVLSNANIVPYKMININLAGKSSTGKSTMAELALSPFGNPAFSENGLGFTLATTINAVYDSFDGINGLSRALDDINQNDRLNMDELIYALFAGEPKRRMGKQNTENRCGWSGTNIITSETPIILEMSQKGGVHARVITLEMEQWTSSKEEAEIVHRNVADNFGWAGQEFAEFVINSLPHLQGRYASITKEINERIIVRDSLTDRICGQIAAIALTAELYSKFKPNAFQWSYSDLIEPFIESEQKMVSERDIGNRIMNILREYITTNTLHFNRENFCIDGTISTPPSYADAPFGVIKNYCDSKDLSLKYRRVYVYSEHFIDLMTRKKVFDFKAGLVQLRQNGVLICDSDKRLQTKMEGIRCYCFMIEEDIGGDK